MKSKIPYHLFFLISIVSCSESNTKGKTNPIQRDSIAKDSTLRILISTPTLEDSCSCDSNSLKKLAQQKSFNSIQKYDATSFSKQKFYDLDSQINRTLWFRDIESPRKTKFTELWNSYHSNNYYADPVDFLRFYETKKDVPLAFIFGPNGDLWAYHIFVIKKIECCYLVTRSYYRHNRFTYKAFAVFDNGKLKDLYNTISKINLISPESKKSYGYTGYFIDNLNSKKFLIDFENETVKTMDSIKVQSSKPKQEILDLYKFVDKGFHWTKTFGE